MKKNNLAKSVASWLGHDVIDQDLGIQVDDVEAGVRFVVQRGSTVIGERTLEVANLPCGDVRAAVGLGIASAIDVTILSSLGVAPNAEPVPAKPAQLLPRVLSPTAPAPAPAEFPSADSLLPSRVYYPPILETPPPPPLVSKFAPSAIGPRPDDLTLEPKPSRVPRRARPIPTWTLNVEVYALIDVLPKVALGVAPSLEVSVQKWLDLRASILATTTRTIEIPDTSGTLRGSSSTGLVAGRLDACAAAELGGLTRLRGCLGLLAGGGYASGAGVATPHSATGAWVVPTIRGDLRRSITQIFGMMLAVDGYFPVQKPQLQIVDKNGNIVAARSFPLAGLGISLAPSLSF